MAVHTIVLSDRGLAAVLAGLRLLAASIEDGEINEMLYDVLTNWQQHPPMTPEEIDRMAEGINCGDYAP